jgi:hypothetical protein
MRVNMSHQFNYLRFEFANGVYWEARGRVVVKALCYKPEGRGFKTRLGEWIFSVYLILPAALSL